MGFFDILAAVGAVIFFIMSVIIFSHLKLRAYLRRTDGDIDSDYVDEEVFLNEKDERFSNALYMCTNESCDKRFVRMYQMMNYLKVTNSHGSTDPTEEEINIARKQEPEDVEQTDLLICPHCEKGLLDRCKEFSWMDTDPNFPKLSIEGLTSFRNEYREKEKVAIQQINILEQYISEKENLEAFLWHYRLDGQLQVPNEEIANLQKIRSDELELKNREIADQITLLEEQMPFAHLKKRVKELRRRLMVKGEDLFRKNSVVSDELGEYQKRKQRINDLVEW